jgi:hypothetical protein
MDNRDRENDIELKPDANEGSGSSKCSVADHHQRIVDRGRHEHGSEDIAILVDAVHDLITHAYTVREELNMVRMATNRYDGIPAIYLSSDLAEEFGVDHPVLSTLRDQHPELFSATPRTLRRHPKAKVVVDPSSPSDREPPWWDERGNAKPGVKEGHLLSADELDDVVAHARRLSESTTRG